MKEIKTNNGKKGGWLVGKRHYDKNGKPLGGIKAIVTDAGGKPVELEGGEVIINREASKKHWKELSRINQSAGNGVAIGPPAGLDEDPEEYKEGGRVIEFNPNHIPNKWILSYAEKIKAKHPEIWKLGGNIFGNEAFNNLKRVADRGHWLDSEEWMYIKWRSYVARHQRDYRIEGVVAMLKWVDKVEKGWPYMKQLIEEKIDKLSKKGWKHKAAKMKDGGDIENKKISKVKTIIYTEKDYEQNIKLYQNIIDKKRNNWEQAQNEYDLIISRVPFTTWYLDLKKGENKFEFLENTYEVFSETKKIVGTSYTQRNFSETKWGIKPIEIKNEDTHLKKFKITTGSSAYFKTKELLITNVNEHFKDLILRKVIDVQMPKSIMKDGGSVAQTPAPKKDRIFGSDVNKQKSSSSAKSGSSIKFSKELTYTISDKVKEHNSNNPSKKVTLAVAKAVVRRGMGAYSSSHRPTITGGKPNDRTAWGLARLNAFFYKIDNGKSKSGKYTQDDDLIEDLEICVRKLKNGGSLGKYAFVESITTTGKKVFKLFDHVPTNKEVFEYFKTTKDEKGNPVIIEDSTIRIETFSGFDRDSFLEQVNKVALKQFGSEIDDMDELMFSFDRYSLNVFPFEAELENDMDVVISVVDGVIFIEPTRKMKDGGNIEYQSRDLNGTMVYYKRKDGSKWDFISKDEFDRNANKMNTVIFNQSDELSMGTLTTKDKKTKLDYKKVGNDFEFVVYDSEPNPIHKVLMNHDQFINYLYDEGYIDDKMKDGGELAMGIKAEHEHSKTISKFKKPGVSDLDIETAIAKDHLKEDSHYYSKLAKMEGKKYAQGGVLQIGSTGILKGRTNKDVQIISISDKIVTYLDVESGKKTGLYKDKFIEKFIDKGTIETDIDVKTKVQKISKPIQKIHTKEAFKIDADYVSLFEINLDKTSEMMKKVTDDQLIDNQLFSFNKIVESMGLKS
jgi:hypothetical protein